MTTKNQTTYTGNFSGQDKLVIEALDASIVEGMTATLETQGNTGDYYKYEAEVEQKASASLYFTTVNKIAQDGTVIKKFVKVFDNDTGKTMVKEVTQ